MEMLSLDWKMRGTGYGVQIGIGIRRDILRHEKLTC
jgi:hypothetical protein